MPIYEYQCHNCEHQFEKLESMSAEPCKTCPECGKNHVQRMISASGFHLKGEGWYVNDYKKKPTATKDSEMKTEKSETSAQTKTTASSSEQTKTKTTATHSEKQVSRIAS